VRDRRAEQRAAAAYRPSTVAVPSPAANAERPPSRIPVSTIITPIGPSGTATARPADTPAMRAAVVISASVCHVRVRRSRLLEVTQWIPKHLTTSTA
jgi:hypothetical protein